MNNDIKKLSNGDFEVLPLPAANEDMEIFQTMEQLIKEAMMIPAPLMKEMEFKVVKGREQPEGGHIELYFDHETSAPPGIADDMPKNYMLYGEPADMKAELDDLEKHLPGVQESDFDCIMCDMGIPLVGAQPQQGVSTNPSGNPDDIHDDFMWGIVKINDGKEYFLKEINDEGKRVWTLDSTNCKLLYRQSEAERYITENIGDGQAGVRGFLVDG